MGVEHFSILEAVELAVGIEEEGINFYTLAAEKVEEEELKKLFLTLKDKEHGHIRTFRRLYSELAAKSGDPDADLYMFDPEVAAYFRGYVETAVFPVKGAAAQVVAACRSAEDILRLAMQAEKDSLLYYHELLHHAPFPDAEELVKEIIGEEHRHFAVLQRELKKVTQ
jgi:rubrerythrin